jgi:hypothetical protein
MSSIAAGIRKTIALAGAALLVVGLLSVAGADPGGNGKGNGNGASNGNGGNSGANGNSGKGSKSKDKQGDDDAEGDADGTATAGAGSAERDGNDYVPDELVVANLGEARDDVGRLGFVVVDEQDLASLGLTVTRLRVPRQMTAPAARTLLTSRFPNVLVDLNAVYRSQGQLVLPPRDYATKLIGWGSPPDSCGVGLRIGMLDTAVDAESAGLRGARIVQRSFLPSGTNAASDGHGTAIASILVGQSAAGGAGLLPGAELAVAGAFGAGPDGIPIADVMALVSGLDWLVGAQARVINMSFAGDANAVVALALQRVTAGAAIVVAAAGNGGPTAAPPFPADQPGVIGVTAVDSRSQPYVDANVGEHVDFAAPGVRVWTPGPGPAGSYHTGTSFAAPFVAAAVAARLAGGTRTDAVKMVDALAEMALDLGVPGRDPVFGRGLIRIANPCSQLTQ